MARLDIDAGELTRLLLAHGFWFVDVPRTSSTSIRAELASTFGKPFGKRNVVDQQHATQQYVPDHLSALQMCNIVGESNWNSLFTFTMVRNPWDRVLSMYRFRRMKHSIPQGWSFSDYVKHLGKATSKTEHFKFHGHRQSASDYVLDENGKVIVDYIGRYENRAEDMSEIGIRCGDERLGCRLAIQGSTVEYRSYREFYNIRTRWIIGTIYRKDIELFGYRF